MATWTDRCPRGEDGAHDFEPIVGETKAFVGNKWIIALCRKCGVAR